MVSKIQTDAVPRIPCDFTLRLCCEGSAAKNRTPSYPAWRLAAAAFPATLHRAPPRSPYWFLSRLASSSSPSRLCRCGRRLHGVSATAPGLRRRCHPQGTGTTSCRRPCTPSRWRGAASASRLRSCRRRRRGRTRLRRRSTSAASARCGTARRSTFARAAGRRPARRPRPRAPGTRRAAPRRTAGAAPSRPRPASGSRAARRGHRGTPASRAGAAPPSWRSS